MGLKETTLGDHPVGGVETDDEHQAMLRSLAPLTAPEGKGPDPFEKGEEQAGQGDKETKKE